MTFDNNIVTRSIAYIFVNSECNGLKFEASTIKAGMAYKLFKESLKFDEVTTFEDRNKQEIIQEIQVLIDKADNFENNSKLRK